MKAKPPAFAKPVTRATTARPKSTGGICTDEVNGYSCTCANGYEGDNCEIIADDCANKPCQNGGTCVDGANSYTCECAAGYEGTNCETNIDDCADTPCQNGGACTDGVDSYSCECATGFDGDDCETNIDDCTAEPCLNGGTCLDGVDSYTCECLANYEGDHCEIPIDTNDCLDEPCQNGGTCIDGVNTYTCDCINGYEGDNCETCMGLIADSECLHLRIFVSDWQGAGDFGGVAGADSICNSDANSPDNTKLYKALLGLTGVRDLNTDWPLVADAPYFRADGQTLIDTTTAEAVFAFDLTNSVSDTSQECWTGLSSNFSAALNQCGDWTNTSGTANIGISNRINSEIITAYAQFCSRTNLRMYCVESPCEAGLFWSGSACVSGNPPTATIPTGIEVTGSSMAIVNGWYYEDGMHDGQTQYKHESEDVWLFWLDMEDAWVISDDTSAWDTWGSFHYYDYTSANQIPETGWENGSNVSGDITVLQYQAMTGTPYVDQELTAHYVYHDLDGDQEGETQFTWYRCDTPSDAGQVIATTTGPYTLTSLDANK
ncbi:MAG: DUF1554 domain-containing protein, partial [Deltaproteobacteria bacterium]|nr:DUF1554 domain-containing protein [Deltaproteobacteria bacterium]